MKGRIYPILALLCLVLTGCSWMDGNYYSVTPHEAHTLSSDSSDVTASTYRELCAALEDLVASGREKGIIYVGEYDQQLLEAGLSAAVRNTLNATPLGAYAVDDIRYELGSNGGKLAVAVEITYLHGRTEIQKLQQVADMQAATAAILKALTECSSGLVLQVESYSDADVDQLVADFAEEYPQLIMEVPQVAVGIYPETGESRILELKFTYQNSREDLRQMQSYVGSIFDAAKLYISSEDSDDVKLTQLYAFLMERFEYQVETSITPAYSLLRHGVGDRRTFAVVYAAMCRQAGLECHVVTGTRNGEPWYWNIVLDGETYYHVDLLLCSEAGGFEERTDPDMTGYVWDYSAYPQCPEPVTPDITEPVPDAGEETLPPEETTPTEAETSGTEATEPTE